MAVKSAAMVVVPRVLGPALGLVAAFVVVRTALSFVSRYNKKKEPVVNVEMDATGQSSDSSSFSEIPTLEITTSEPETSKIARPSRYDAVVRLNESLFELYKPSDKPSLQILFFHGFQFESQYDNAHISTWESEDKEGTILWPQTWLREEFPDAYILSIAYNCRMNDTREYHGSSDLFILGENLMADLLDENIGQDRHCPVILVGHSFGGLVMKKLCLFAGQKASLDSEEHKKFLENVKGLFFYSTPHGGIRLEKVPPLFESESLLLENVESLSTSTSRLNDEFEQLRRYHKDWKIFGLGESCPTKWDENLPCMVVEEASSRYGDEFLIVSDANHISITRPENKISKTFTFLTKLIHSVNETRRVTGVIHQIHGLPSFSSGLEQRVTDVINILRNDAYQATVLGIVGMGGIGKTTIAKRLFNVISSNYEYTCFADNVKGIPIHDLEDWLLNHFHHDGRNLKRSDAITWKSLEKKKTLIIMDDVDSEDQLKKLPSLDHFGADSHLIITSRKQEVFNVYQSCLQLYEVVFLTPDEAKKLLCQHVFDVDRIDEDHDLAEYVDKLVQKCQGLPLTLEVMGDYIRPYKDNVQFWNQIILKLGEAESIHGGQSDRIWASLKMCYDDLHQGEKDLFIDAGTCFFEKPLEEALAAWSTPNSFVEMTLQNLIRRSLVKVVPKTRENGGIYEEIWVHEHLRDLAKKVSQRRFVPKYDANTFKTSNPRDAILMKAGVDEDEEHRVRFWFDSSETMKEERTGLDFDMVMAEPLLNYDDIEHAPTVQLESFDHMNNLRYLHLDNIVPQGLSANFPHTVSLLRWILSDELGYPDLPRISWTGMSNLGLLHLEGWKLPTEFLEALGKFSNLRIMKLHYLVDLDHLPENIGNLSFLKQLTLQNMSLSALPYSLGRLWALEDLTIGTLRVSELPESFGDLCSLKTLYIGHCDNLRSLPKSFGDLFSLEKLDIDECDQLDCLPESFGRLSSLETLCIHKCKQLGSLPESFGGLKSLKTLLIRECENLESFPESFGSLRSLESLNIRECDSLGSFLESFKDLQRLERLEIHMCENLGKLPESFGDLRSLETLHIKKCAILESLPESFGSLRSLETLEIDGCVKLASLPESFGSLRSFRTLLISNCGNLASLPESFQNLRSLLVRLEISKCSRLQSLPESLGHFSCLKKLLLLDLEIESLPASFGLLTGLEDLHLDAKLEKLPINFGNLSSLTHLELYAAGSSLEELPASFGELSCLQELRLHACSILQRLPDNFGQLKDLKTLCFFNCSTLERLPDSFGKLFCLQELRLHGCSSLQRLPDNFGELEALEILSLNKCSKLESLPDSFGELKSLETLSFIDCSTLQSLPDNFGELKSLKTLSFINCSTLQRLPDNFGELKALKELTIYGALHLQALSNNFGNLRSLTVLKLDDCPILEQLPRNFGFLSKIKRAGSGVSNPEDLNRALHLEVKCTGCLVSPIKGSRYVSITNYDDDLCSNCFQKVNSETDQANYVRINQTPEPDRTQVHIQGCPSLNQSVLTGLGWVRVQRQSSVNIYQRIASSIDSVETNLQLPV